MVWHNIAYLALMLASCFYAFARGGAPERLVATIVFTGTLLTGFAAAPWVATFHSIEFRLMLVDLIALAALLLVSQNANRAWPIMVSGLQLAAVGVHVAEALNGNERPFGYAFLEALPGWAMLPCLAMGTWRHRQRFAFYGDDKAWSSRAAISPRA